jgi:predicted RND superfamily exporter protein
VVLIVGFSRFALVTVLCGLLGTISLLAVAYLIDLKVNFLDFVALPITIGIGIDYAVNICTRARQHASAREALATMGSVVILCSYTTSVGYASLLLSTNHGVRSFGLSALIGELACISTALLFGPAFLEVIDRRRRRPSVA